MKDEIEAKNNKDVGGDRLGYNWRCLVSGKGKFASPKSHLDEFGRR